MCRMNRAVHSFGLLTPIAARESSLLTLLITPGKFVIQLGQSMDAIFCFHCMTMAAPAYIFMISK